MTTITVTVTREMIRRAGRSCDDCPIALAIAPHVNAPPFVRREYANLIKERGFAELPTLARAFVALWDNHQQVSPISFTMEIPEHWRLRK